MSLPAPNLDNRTFQDIVDDVKRQVGLRCPEWTDHNVSDPGITLLELFAYITESTLFQINQVPEKNHIRFLELLGVKLEMPRPAATELRYLLTRPVEDREGAEFQGITVPRDTVASTLRTETEDPIEFLTDFDLPLGRPRLTDVVALPAAVSDAEGVRTTEGTRPFDFESPDLYAPPAPDSLLADPAYRIYDDTPAEGDRLLLGFAADVSGHVLDLEFDVAEKAGVGMVRGYPNQAWEVWDRVDGQWRRLDPLSDTTLGFAQKGVVRLELPHGLGMQTVAGVKDRFWARVRYTELPADLPLSDGREVRPYAESPAIRGVVARTVGGHVPATNCVRVYDEALGESDGKPGQRFRTRHAPIFELDPGDRVLTGPPGAESDRSDWTEWRAHDDFSESGPEAHPFVADPLTGEITFGPQLARPDGGEPDRYGAVPPKGHTIVLTSYAFGGGTIGNVRNGQICVDKANLPYVASVVNPLAARNGLDLETVERAKMRATKILKVRNRAVTAEDYEALARERDDVGRAVCLQPLAYRPDDRKGIPPGTVELLVVPALGDVSLPRVADLVVPPEALSKVQAHLDERRLLTTVLKVREPRYVFVETDITLVADPRLDAETVAGAVRERLARFLHPLTGGPDGGGWPFGRRLKLADIYVQISGVPGVAYLLGTEIYAYRVGHPSTGRFREAEKMDLLKGLDLAPDETLCSRDHIVRPIPLTAKDFETRLGR